MRLRWVTGWVLGALCAGALAAGDAGPSTGGAPARMKALAATPESVERRAASVRKLVEESSAAREIEASGNAEAAAARNQARQTIRLAEAALASGDVAAANNLLEDATRQLFAGARLARGEQARGETMRRDVAARISSARALLSAQQRIQQEKPAAEAGAVAVRVDGLLRQAEALVAQQRYEEARLAAEQAYLLAKSTVTAMRTGDTLTRSLSFGSKEEEYHYEVDRNDTHRMLVTLLAKKQGGNSAQIDAAVERAVQIRRGAEASAARGEYEAAIEQLEDSTRELVRAIRVAGVYIPG